MPRWSHEDRSTHIFLEVCEEEILDGVVSLTTGNYQGDGSYQALPFALTPDKARELGRTLIEYADLADDAMSSALAIERARSTVTSIRRQIEELGADGHAVQIRWLNEDAWMPIRPEAVTAEGGVIRIDHGDGVRIFSSAAFAATFRRVLAAA